MTKNNLPDGWKLETLESISTVIAGQSPPGHTYRDYPEGLPFFQGKADFGVHSPIARKWCIEPIKIALPGDILISVRAPVGPTNTANTECCIGRGLAAIRPKDSIDKRFILAALKNFESSLVKLGSGSTFDAITISDLKSLIIPLPLLDEQKRIAALIDEQMQAIEDARRAAQAELEAAEILIDCQIAEIYSYLIAEYDTVELETLIQNANYGTSVKCFYERKPGAIPILRIPNIISERVDFEDMKYGQVGDKEQTKVTLYQGDIVIVRTNGSSDLVGRCAVIEELEEPTGFASYLIRIHCDEDRVIPQFVRMILKHQRTSGQLLDFANSSAGQFNVSLGRIKAAEIPLPPLKEQLRVVDYLENNASYTLEAVEALRERLNAINELPAAILRRAFNGEY